MEICVNRTKKMSSANNKSSKKTSVNSIGAATATSTMTTPVRKSDASSTKAEQIVRINNQIVDTTKSFELATPQTLYTIKNTLVRELTKAIQLVRAVVPYLFILLFKN